MNCYINEKRKENGDDEDEDEDEDDDDDEKRIQFDWNMLLVVCLGIESGHTITQSHSEQIFLAARHCGG